MKAAGIVLIGIGIALLLFTFLRSFRSAPLFVSPIPDGKGMRVIFVSPGN